MSRVLAVDFGDSRVGVAISDPDGKISLPRGFIAWERRRDLLDRIASLCRDNQVEEVIVGLPKSLDGSEGPRARKTRKWADRLKESLQLDVSLWDERFTSRAALREIHAMGGKVGDSKGRVDEIAAALLLQSYLDSRNQQPGS